MRIVTRFAPSPTGVLHVGNLRTAVHNWLLARAAGPEGACWLRLDDTDTQRSEERYVDAIHADLDWLGMTPAGVVRQSARGERYEAAFAALVAAGRVYACHETPEELALARKVQRMRGLPPIYRRDGAGERGGERNGGGEGPPHWRFAMAEGAPIAWEDGVRGPQTFDPATLSDPVIRRADGSWLYLLPSVVDDIAMGITDVVRGEDHVTNTAVQLQMFEALGAAPPRFAHAALLTGADGKLSKRLGATGTAALREAGIEPQAVIAFLARLGSADPVEPIIDPNALAAAFALDRLGRAPARYDEGELSALSARIVHQLPHGAVADRLPAALTAPRWEAVRANIARVAEAADWLAVFDGPLPVAPAPDADRPVVAAAAALLAGEAEIAWDAGEGAAGGGAGAGAGGAWRALTTAVGAATGTKGRALFLPLRQALTGRAAGPDMAVLLPLIPRPVAAARLAAAAGPGAA